MRTASGLMAGPDKPPVTLERRGGGGFTSIDNSPNTFTQEKGSGPAPPAGLGQNGVFRRVGGRVSRSIDFPTTVFTSKGAWAPAPWAAWAKSVMSVRWGDISTRRG